MNRLTNLVLLCMTIMFLWSCNLDYFEDAEIGDIVFDPSIALPVGEITYTVEELFEELNDAGAEIGSTDEDVVSLIYEQQLQSQSASSFLSVLDQSFGSSLQGGTTVINPLNEVRFSSNNLFEFDLDQRGNEEYDSLVFQDGQLSLDVNSNFGSQVNFNVTFVSLEDNGVALVASGTLTPANPSFNLNQSLAGFTGIFSLDQNGNPTTNTFLVNLTYEVVVQQGETVNASDRIDFNVGVTNTTFDVVYGDVGNQELTVSFDVANLDFFDQLSGSITFADPSATLIFQNSFGFPLGVTFPEFAAVTGNGTIIPLTGPVTTTPNIISGPQVEQQGQIEMTNLVIDVDNSNIDELLSSRPSSIVVDVSTESNPSTAPDQYNFVNIDSELSVSSRIEVPLDLNLNQVSAEESVNFTNGEDLQDATRLLFRVFSENELPMGGEIELQFKDNNDNTVYTVDQQTGFNAAPVGANDRTTEIATATADILMEEDDIRAIENATSIAVIVTLNTTDAQSNQAVKFFNDYELRFKLAVQANVEVNSNGN